MDKHFEVQNWIEKNFVIEKIKIENFDLFPYGKRVIDHKGNEMVVFYDLLKGCVDYKFPDERR